MLRLVCLRLCLRQCLKCQVVQSTVACDASSVSAIAMVRFGTAIQACTENNGDAGGIGQRTQRLRVNEDVWSGVWLKKMTLG